MEHPESYSGSAGVHTENRAGDGTHTFGQAAHEVTQDVRQRGSEVLNKVADEAQTLVGRLRGEATGALGEGKTQLVAQVGGVARALRAGSREFRKDNLTGLADLGEGLADEVEAVQHYLSDRSSESLLTDLRTFASRNRGLFVGSLFVAGLVAVRFARSTPAERTASSRPGGSRTTVVTRRRVNTYRAGRP